MKNPTDWDGTAKTPSAWVGVGKQTDNWVRANKQVSEWDPAPDKEATVWGIPGIDDTSYLYDESTVTYDSSDHCYDTIAPVPANQVNNKVPTDWAVVV